MYSQASPIYLVFQPTLPCRYYEARAFAEDSRARLSEASEQSAEAKGPQPKRRGAAGLEERPGDHSGTEDSRQQRPAGAGQQQPLQQPYSILKDGRVSSLFVLAAKAVMSYWTPSQMVGAQVPAQLIEYMYSCFGKVSLQDQATGTYCNCTALCVVQEQG